MDPQTPDKPSSYALITQQIREHLIPFNAVIALGITLWAVIDFTSPLLGVPGLLLAAGLMSLAAALCFWRMPPEPVQKRLKALGLGLALLALGLGTASASLRVGQGGWIASSFGKARDVQAVLFDLQTQVARVQQGVDQANQTLSRIDQRTEDLGTAGAGCGDFLCLILENAPVQRYEALKASGIDPRTVPLMVASRLAEESMPQSAEAVRFMIASGMPGDINQPLFPPQWQMVFQPQSFAKPTDRRAILTRVLMRQMRVGPERQKDLDLLIDSCSSRSYDPRQPEMWRWLDVAALHGNKDVVQMLLKLGADPRLPIPFCNNFRADERSRYAGYEPLYDLLDRAPELRITAQDFID